MRHLRIRTMLGPALALVALALGVAACGGGDSGPSAPAKPGKPEKRTINVGVLPLADLAPFYLAMREGYFKDEGLTVKPRQAPGGAAQIASMVAGELDLTFSNYVSVLQAAEKGLPMRIVHENNRSGPQGIFAMTGRGIDGAEDLAGKKVAVNSLRNIQELTARAEAESHGVDPDSVRYVELEPPEMQAALEKGEVDAAWLAEPFITLASRTGKIEKVVGAFEGPTHNLPVAGWAATAQFVEKNPNTLAAFSRAMDRALRKAVDDPQAVARVIPTFTTIKPGIATKLNKPGLAVRSNLGDLKRLEDLMIKYGIIKKKLDLGTVVVSEDELPHR